MSDHVFYGKKNRANNRKVTVNNAVLLVGKAPTKAKRIKLKLTMGLSTQKHSGTPDWVANAFEFVAKNHDPVSPIVDFKGFDIGFAVNNLFGDESVAAVRCQMRSFEVSEMGGVDTPDVVMSFLVYAPFSTGLWNWLGQYAGDEVWAKFAQIETADDDLTLTGEDAEEDEEDEAAA